MRHYLVVAAASRGARLFIKKALLKGHNVTALCRAPSDELALKRMQDLLEDTVLTPTNELMAQVPGRLIAKSANILKSNTYVKLLMDDLTIDSICCFVGPTKFKDMMSPRCTIYTDTISAILEGLKEARLVDLYFHSSVGVLGQPVNARLAIPQNFPFYLHQVLKFIPVFRNLVKSERILGGNDLKDFEYIVFRPASLTDGCAKRKFGYCFNETSYHDQMLPLKKAKLRISREDVAEEILRVTELDRQSRKKWVGQGVYLVDLI
ncbi:NADH(P)-binding protein, PF13460 family [Bacteriovorax sp. BSW11_IV]|uniref:NADH(P)-binding protein, PF13460 family n=1 Tax=Bacteriovorax sp. BSW11_IV TaxID=1353529 RepID=UPI00038A4A0E|nr:NADH(P)-binding protein, PF13460 family [Bacteriovorax sp. BSW11_IV]EQC48634.1 NADH(P)-binding protein, PF13460 family [Bacteriovorax sp. BSW11_IV]